MDSMEELMIERRLAHYAQRAHDAEAALTQCQHDLAEMIERKEVMRNCWESAETELAALANALRAPCMWKPEADGFRTKCGAWYISHAIMNGAFCPYCGHPIEVAK